MIRDVINKDAGAIAEIYNYYIENTAATFEEQPVSASEIWKRIQKVQNSGLPWIVAIESEFVIGYAYATPWKERSAYRFSVESTVYLTKDAQGKGYGSRLYQALLEKLKTQKVNSVIGGITLPNAASIALHEKIGMQKVAHFKDVGYKFEKWQDVGYWQLNLSNAKTADISETVKHLLDTKH